MFIIYFGVSDVFFPLVFLLDHWCTPQLRLKFQVVALSLLCAMSLVQLFLVENLLEVFLALFLLDIFLVL